MEPLTIGVLAAAGLGIWALRSRPSNVTSPAPGLAPIGAADPGAGGLAFSLYGPNSDPREWFMGMKPGTVTIADAPAPAGWTPGNMATAQTAAGLAGTGAGLTLGIAGAVHATASGGAFAAGTALGTAIPVFGIGVAVVATVLGVISAHHKQAVADEAAGLNKAVPHVIQAFVLILQAVLQGEVTTVGQADGLVQNAINDFYAIVKPIQHGTWRMQGSVDEIRDPSLGDNVQLKSRELGKPGTCNGPCEIGHYVAEGFALTTRATVRRIFAGEHGVAFFWEIPAHAGFAGFPAVKVTY